MTYYLSEHWTEDPWSSPTSGQNTGLRTHGLAPLVVRTLD